MSLRKENLDTISYILQKEYRDGLSDGIAEGLRVAEYILTLFLANPQLKEPHSVETLEKWSREQIQELRNKI